MKANHPSDPGKMLSNAERNTAFLAGLNQEKRDQILESIANHYRSSPMMIHEEVTSHGAEHLLEYMVEPHRSTTQKLMQKLGLAGQAYTVRTSER